MKISQKKKAQIWLKSNGKCWYCGKTLVPYMGIGNIDYFTVDHLIPNKNNNIDNLVPSCRSCNSSKRNRTLEEFRIILGKKQGIIYFNEKELDFIQEVFKTEYCNDIQTSVVFNEFYKKNKPKFWFEINNKNGKK